MHTGGPTDHPLDTCRYDTLPVEQIHKWKKCEQCRHPEHSSACAVCRCLAVTSQEEIADKCMGAGGCPEHPTVRQERWRKDDATGLWGRVDPPLTPEEEEEVAPEDRPSLPPCRACKHTLFHFDRSPCASCGGEHYRCRACRVEQVTCARKRPEEEETLPPPEGPEYTPCLACGHIEPEHEPNHDLLCFVKGCKCMGYRTESDEPKPPQPERRPPLAYAYAVQGHLYEVALPGDATVKAVDGALIITHSLGPIAGIVQARPLEGEQSA